ncbi:2-oxoglutarate dehydrogenase, E2 component, dihydrolipoamide succinyltransferase [Amycolatopsis sp. H20-H5]|uniref:2-oxoglutarate dehydrogenase, E2 component, dihydrolipoamide succinyltransferase n=1 Tax=Amycolatopsis sp. H20-H5 TaxID=3046309 RepID=UPI002DBE021A|nr:2-oxoglutarate dehydrogenase, E2 component, dihydrolipoamide succinyltransferase [Amycolatopsis sp. H20-H5]MEC3982051.1 2-oxoglutarate dehydrogenase, E2 component, dihydrolipoamide succinyltransferase [Amycolatopsis sp. H20-H5]
MAYSVTLPELGESVTEGTVTRWLKQEGDTVEVDEPLLEISTDKVDTEVPSPVAGTVVKISAQEDETVEVGAELAVIDDGSGGGGEQQSRAEEKRAEPEPEPEPEPAQQEQASTPEPAPQASSGGSAEGTEVKLPELGESVTEGTVTRWLKQVGDSVAVDEPLLEISTDKVDTEVPSPVAGTVLEIRAAEDETVEVGGVLAVIGDANAAPKAEPKPEPKPEPVAQAKPEPKPEPVEQAKPDPKPEPKPEPEPVKAESNGAAESSDSGPYVTPLVRKLATEHGIDLASLTGSGVGGRIRKQDVLAAAEAKQKEAKPAPAPAAAPAASAPAASASAPAPKKVSVSPELAALRGTVQKASRIRQITATKTRESLQVSAQLTQVHEVDVTKVAKLRQRAKVAFKEREGVNLTFLPFFAKATVEALKQHPNVNASYNEDTKEITYHGAVHLGIAVDTDKGLLNVVIHDAGELSIAGLAHRIADLAGRARSNHIKPDELAGGTFTITNIGSNGALFDTPIIMQPQSGMLGTGAVVKRPVVIVDADGNDTIAVRSMAYLPLTYDHRLVDGADAGRFVTTIKQRLEEGNFEGELGL